MIGSDSGDFKGTERFLVQRRIGSGGFGVVYEAYDQEKRAIVALKTFHQNNAEALYRFKQEFRALSDVIHPNLVALYEMMSDGQHWFFTMEMVDGVDFIEYVRHSDMPESKLLLGQAISPSDHDRLRSALKQLAKGIYTLHQAGKLHCDIKPSNVLVTKEGRVVLLDFGVVTEILNANQVARPNNGVDISGTPIYMSPEQGLGKGLTEASDWYSVGVMLFEALTGFPPFEGSYMEIMMDKQRSEPPAPDELAIGVPADLNDICVRLLRRLPAERLNGEELLSLLESVRTNTGKLDIGVAKTLRNSAIIGREIHLSILREAFQNTRAQRTSLVLVNGLSGMGKSSLIRSFLDELREKQPEAVILSGRCYEREMVPYKTLDSLMDALSRYLIGLPRSAVKTILPRDILALGRLFPVLQQVNAIMDADREVLAIPDSQELRRRASTALKTLLHNLASLKPLILFIDDLQWGDADSTVLLKDLLSPPDTPPLMLIGSCRSEEVATVTALQAFKSMEQSSSINLFHVDVTELNFSDAKSLVLMLLEEESEAASRRAEVIAKESNGFPFFITELVQYAKNGDQAVNNNHHHINLEQVISARINSLPKEMQQLMEVIAVAGYPLPRAVAIEAAGLTSDDPTLINMLRNLHMLRISGIGKGEELEAYHDRIRETVVAQLSPTILTTTHRRLAISLEASGQADLETLALHFQSAAIPDKTIKYTAAAAEQATTALAFDRAAKLYRQTLEMLNSLPASQRSIAGLPPTHKLRISLAHALVNTGRSAEAAEAFLAASEEADKGEAIELQRCAAEHLLRSGYIDDGLKIMNRVLNKIGMKMANTPKQALFSLFVRRALVWWRGLKYEKRELAQISAEELLRVDTCWSISIGLSLVDTIRGADFQARHLLLALQSGEEYRISRALAIEGAFSSSSGGRSSARTEKVLHMAMTLSKELDNPHSIALATLTSGIAAFCEGRWKNLREKSEHAAQILREQCTGVTWELDNAAHYLLRALFYLGEWSEMFHSLPTLLREAQERGDIFFSTQLATRSGYVIQLAADQPERATEELAQVMSRWTRTGFHLQHYYNLFAQGQIDLYSGNANASWQRIIKNWPAMKSSLILRNQVILIESFQLRARCALAVAATAKDPEPLLSAAASDAKFVLREKMTWGNALAWLVEAGIAAMRGQLESAINQLITTEATFEEADMSLHVAATRARRGTLIGGSTGKALVDEARQCIAKQKVKNPDRIIDMIAPGKWSKN